MLRVLPALNRTTPPPPFQFPPGRHGRAELGYIHGVPVLRVAGTPEEAAEQTAALAVRPAMPLLDYPLDLLASFVGGKAVARLLFRLVLRVGEKLLAQFPEAHRRELDAYVAAGLDRGRVLAANTMLDMKNIPLGHLFGCSSLVVPAASSATGGPLFGRNLDFFSLGYLHRYNLVTVRARTPATRAFAALGFPGLVGCYSGMNDAGLALASHEVFDPPGPRRFNPLGPPFALAYRRVLEECATTTEAVELLSDTERTTSTMLALCDRDGGLVLELTPDLVAARFAACANHFESQPLAGRRPPRKYHTAERLRTLRSIIDAGAPFGVDRVRAALALVAQGDLTIQTMVFEPRAPRVHVGFGPPPSAAGPLVPPDLAPLFS
jgi:isopenicillin-N N-acyltransferase-like protein